MVVAGEGEETDSRRTWWPGSPGPDGGPRRSGHRRAAGTLPRGRRGRGGGAGAGGPHPLDGLSQADRVSVRESCGTPRLSPPHRRHRASGRHRAPGQPQSGRHRSQPGWTRSRAVSSSSPSWCPSCPPPSQPVHAGELRRAGHGIERPPALRPLPAAAGSAVAGTARPQPCSPDRAVLSRRLPDPVPHREHHDLGQGHGPPENGTRRPPDRLLRTVLRDRPRIRLPAAVPGPRPRRWCSTGRWTPT